MKHSVVGGTAAVAAPASSEVMSIALVDLTATLSFREDGLNREHVERLVDLAGHWPPILVRRADRRVVDGAHRVAAARQLGLGHIEASLFDGGPDDALIEFVRRNVHHGLPLTLRERKHAALRILAAQPGWSDRRLAEVCGVSPKTVGRLRTVGGDCPSGEPPQLDIDSRVGRDNRSRPIDGTSLRSRIAEEITAHPGASLRAVASTVGASPETVRSVRLSMTGSPGAPSGAGRAADPPVAMTGPPAQPVPPPWRDDAAILSRADGDDFVAWFDQTSVSDEDCMRTESVPLSRIYEIADEARRRSEIWSHIAQLLEARSAKNTVRSLRAERRAG